MALPISAGEILLASDVNALNDSDWTTFTPVWTASGTTPVIGNGTLQGWYRESGTDMIDMAWRWVAGSTTTYGTGTWYFSSPIAASADSILRGVGPAYISDLGTADKCGCIKFVTATTIAFIAATTIITPTTPQTFANGDSLLGAMSYEPA
jgi:hypothetical protein